MVRWVNLAKQNHRRFTPRLIITCDSVQQVKMDEATKTEILVGANQKIYKPGGYGYMEAEDHYNTVVNL